MQQNFKNCANEPIKLLMKRVRTLLKPVLTLFVLALPAAAAYFLYVRYGHSFLSSLYHPETGFFPMTFGAKPIHALPYYLAKADALVYRLVCAYGVLVFLVFLLRKRQLAVNILFFVLLLAICLAFAEVLLWRFAPVGIAQITRQFYRPSKNPDVVYEPVPLAGDFNSDGLRGQEFPHEKPANTFRIVIIGDSIAYGLNESDFNHTYAKNLERKLNARLQGGKKYEVLNLGVPGYQITQIIERLKEKGLPYHPDLVIYGYWLDDVAVSDGGELFFFSNFANRLISSSMDPLMSTNPLVRQIKEVLLKSQTVRRLLLLSKKLMRGQGRDSIRTFLVDHPQYVPPAHIQARYEQYLRHYKAHLFQDLNASEPYYEFYADTDNFLRWSKKIHEFAELCHREILDCLVLMTPVLYPHEPSNYHYEPLHSFIGDILEYYSLRVLDLKELFVGDRVSQWSMDSEHPNTLGNEMIADALVEYLSLNHLV